MSTLNLSAFDLVVENYSKMLALEDARLEAALLWQQEQVRRAEADAARAEREAFISLGRKANDVAERVEINGVKPPGPYSNGGVTWALARAMTDENGSLPAVDHMRRQAEELGLDLPSLGVDYSRWCRYHGVSAPRNEAIARSSVANINPEARARAKAERDEAAAAKAERLEVQRKLLADRMSALNRHAEVEEVPSAPVPEVSEEIPDAPEEIPEVPDAPEPEVKAPSRRRR